jgi:hypothetical protein
LADALVKVDQCLAWDSTGRLPFEGRGFDEAVAKREAVDLRFRETLVERVGHAARLSYHRGSATQLPYPQPRLVLRHVWEVDEREESLHIDLD